MAFKIAAAQKRYTVSFSPAGLPIAQVDLIGRGRWISCCSLCGFLHILPHTPGLGDGSTYAPECPARTQHPAIYQAWQTAHPESAGHQQVILQYRQIQVIPLAAPDEQPSQGERAA
jgi:hypothetical protein